MSGLANYYFLPVARRGLAAALESLTTVEDRAELTVRVTASGSGSTNASEVIEKKVRVYGPGDVRGFDPRSVTRTDPAPYVGDFEPNYLAAIEFADPDFPWRYSAAAANTTGKLTPWISLIALEPSEFTEPELDEAAPSAKDRRDVKLRSITVTDAASLPDLTQAWRWAHVQFTAEAGLASVVQRFREVEDTEPERTVARLLCPRRLRPSARYHAFVVPSFKLGVIAPGYATRATGDNALSLAWGGTGPVRLPYYYRWEFGTSERGDFEYLVRLLEARKLSGLGKRPIDCSEPGYKLPNPDSPASAPRVLEIEGALKSLDTVFTQWGRDEAAAGVVPFQDKLAREVLNLPFTSLQGKMTSTVPAASTAVTDITMTLSWVAGLTGVAETLDAIVTYKTSRPAVSSKVIMGAIVGSGAALTSARLVHSAKLTKLAPGARYTFRVTALVDGNIAVESRAVSVDTPVPPVPTLVPPIYGRSHAGRLTVQAERSLMTWLDELNLDPRHRAVAGLGALVIEQQQEALMASAWEQLGDIESANALLRNAQLGREAAAAVLRRFGALAPGQLLRLTAPLHGRVRAPSSAGVVAGDTIAAFLRRTKVPVASVDPSFRRILRETGPIRRRQPALDPKREDAILRLNLGRLTTVASMKPEGVVRLGDVTTALRTVARAPSAVAAVGASGTALGTAGAASSVPTSAGTTAPTPTWRFSEENITSGVVRQAIAGGALQRMSLPADVSPKLEGALSGALDGWLRSKQPAKDTRTELDAQGFAANLRSTLDPRAALARRMGQLLKLAPGVLRGADALDEIVASPEFPQPMYEPLRDISNDLLLPGLDQVPQNTLALLETNRRFVESYMAALNHVFAVELLWRGAPVGRRSTYFRQFWDVDAAVPETDFSAAAAALVPQTNPNREAEIARKVEAMEKAFKEKLADIAPMARWDRSRLGSGNHAGSGGDRLVLLIRGELLRKYPNTVVYAIPAAGTAQAPVPALDEFGSGALQPIFPLFSGSLPPDVWFFGFPFTEEDARGKTPMFPKGLFFVLEERVSEARFGLDESSTGGAAPLTKWDELTWDQLGPKVLSGGYINGSKPADAGAALVPKWDESSAAIARVTFQKPVRIAVHAERMLPPD